MKVYTPREVAETLQLSSRTVYSYLRSGKLPGRKIGDKRWRVLEEDLKAFIRGESPQEV